jgi:hypothetical protein
VEIMIAQWHGGKAGVRDDFGSDYTSEEECLELIRAFPLMSIEDDARLAAALTVIDKLVERPTGSLAEDVWALCPTCWRHTRTLTAHCHQPPM